MNIDALWVGWGEGADYYRLGQGGVSEITESEYRICGDPYPCFLVEFDDGKTIEIRSVRDCSIRRDPTLMGQNKKKELGMSTKNSTNKARTPGSCGGTPKRDGSGGGKGNRNTPRQPSKKK